MSQTSLLTNFIHKGNTMEWMIFTGFFTLVVFWYLYQQKEQNKSMERQFKSLSLDALQKSQESFLHLAKEVLHTQQTSSEKDLESKKKEIEHLLMPMKEMLLRLDQQNREIERKREGAYGSLEKQIDQLIDSERHLRTEAYNLAKALKSPNVRGSWGQVHLRRVVELSGMLNRCDFFEQVDVRNEGKIYRPDLVVRLPGKREIVIDAKVSLESYLEASNAEDFDKKKKYLQDYAQNVKRHVKTLSSKEYWKQFSSSPEYVILFLPAEAFFSAALDQDPSIVEMGMGQNVIIATPTTLIAILKAVALGWRQETISKDAQKIALLGKELYERMIVMSDHWNKVGKNLSQSVDAYNQATSSLESRVLVSARKLQESSSEKHLFQPKAVEKSPKTFYPVKDFKEPLSID